MTHKSILLSIHTNQADWNTSGQGHEMTDIDTKKTTLLLLGSLNLKDQMDSVGVKGYEIVKYTYPKQPSIFNDKQCL